MGNQSRCYRQCRRWALWFLPVGKKVVFGAGELLISHGCLVILKSICALTHILAHGLACKITLMHINSWLFHLWRKIPTFLGAVSIPCIAHLVQSCLLMNNLARTELHGSGEIDEVNFRR